VTRRRVTAFVEALVRNRRPEGFRADADDRDAMRAAIDLRSARAEEMAPSSQFVDELHDQLRQQIEGEKRPEMPRAWPRRWVLEGAVAASAAGVAVAIDRTVFASSSAPTVSAPRQLAPDAGTWHVVAERAALTGGAVTRFSTAGAVGFVANDNGMLAAVSGVCSHQGCLLTFNENARRLDCPCHRAAFSLSGEVLFSELPTAPPPLPRLATRDEGGHVQVYVPRPT
jgi:cytochrome b6-f complex iron-sulfur subunit